MGICAKILCWPRDVKRLTERVHSEGVYETNVRVQRCGHESVGLNLGGHRQVCGSDTPENSIEVVCKRIQNEEAR